jgi:adenylate kinase family enzyme
MIFLMGAPGRYALVLRFRTSIWFFPLHCAESTCFSFPSFAPWKKKKKKNSGKGTHSAFILKALGISNPPVVMSTILRSPNHSSSSSKSMSEGTLINDAFVLQSLLSHLLSLPDRSGVLIDGFPRTEIQVELLKLLHERLAEMRREFFHTELRTEFPRPVFRIAVLFVDEGCSVERQIARGTRAKEHNRTVRETGAFCGIDLALLVALPTLLTLFFFVFNFFTISGKGVGELVEERPTDFDVALIRKRYRIFRGMLGFFFEFYSRLCSECESLPRLHFAKKKKKKIQINCNRLT